MIKKLLSIALIAAAVSANAQQGSRKMNKQAASETAVLLKSGHNSASALVCDTISPILPTDSLRLYTVGSANGGGYVAGNNGYGDLKKATFIPGALIPAGSQITGVYCIFFKEASPGTKGTKGTGAVTFEIYNGDTLTGPSGAAIGSAPSTMATIISGGTQVSNSLVSLIPFGTPVNAPSTGFFVSMTLPTTTGDTAVFWMARNMSQTWHSYAWEMWTPSGWHSFVDPNNWNLPGFSLTMLPVLCYNSTGVHNNALEAGFAMYPNPTSGSLSFVVTLPEATNLNVNVVNALGESVFTATEKNTKGGIFSYDLSSLSKGVYFANITDGNNNKIVKKIIVE